MALEGIISKTWSTIRTQEKYNTNDILNSTLELLIKSFLLKNLVNTLLRAWKIFSNILTNMQFVIIKSKRNTLNKIGPKAATDGSYPTMLLPMNCLSVFAHFVGLNLKGLTDQED